MSPLASTPRGPVPVPEAVRVRAPHAEAVWRNELGGLTFRDAAGARFLKWNPAGTGLSLATEAERLAWAAPFHPVPEVLEYADGPEGELLVTRALPGESAVSSRWSGDPRTAVRAIGQGLRALHEALPVEECPFEWSAATRLGRLAQDVREAIGEPPPVDRLVVCHGDACAPNTLVGDDGRWTAHVDLAALGTADRWADVAVAAMSLAWNYGEGWDAELYAAYGIEPDPERIAYYRALWNAG